MTIDAAPEKAMDEHSAERQRNVLRAVNTRSCRIQIPHAGKHTLKIMMIDPGVIIDKMELVQEDEWMNIALRPLGSLSE